MNSYEINSKTLAIIPFSTTSSKIIEEETEFIIDKTPIEIIDHSCRFFGSSYIGRHEGTKEVIGINYKTPILIEETRNLIFFPTCSSRMNNCCWISLEQIQNYTKYCNVSKVIFKNGQELTLDISLGSLENQILRSTMLDSMLRKRRKISI